MQQGLRILRCPLEGGYFLDDFDNVEAVCLLQSLIACIQYVSDGQDLAENLWNRLVVLDLLEGWN